MKKNAGNTQDQPVKAPADSPELAAKVARLKELTTDFTASCLASLAKAVALGEHLLAMKKDIAFGQWLDRLKQWAKESAVTPRTLERAMEVADYHQKGKLQGVQTLNDAYDCIAKLKAAAKGVRVPTRLPWHALAVGRSTAGDLAVRVKGLAAENVRLPAPVIHAEKMSVLRKAVTAALDECGKQLLKVGGVIIVDHAVPARAKDGKK